MNNNSIIFIGLDTHKDFDEVAYCEDERLSKPIHQGRIPNTKQAITKLIRQLQQRCISFMKPVLVVIGFTVSSPASGTAAISLRPL